MKAVFRYRDASNYKDIITIDYNPVAYPAMVGLQPDDDVEMSSVGVTYDDIPMIVSFGVDKDDDHTSLEFIKYEEEENNEQK